MKHFFKEIKTSLLHLAFPHVCEGCGSDVLEPDHALCLRCFAGLPATRFAMHAGNPVERIFWGRLQLSQATAQYYFTKASTMQRLMHAFKYRGNKEIGLYLGQLMGQDLAASGRFANVDCLVPLPLFAPKEKKRGYNQAAVLCQGISKAFDKPIVVNAVIKKQLTDSQTHKTRVGRWQNIEDRFELHQPSLLKGKHVLLVDDVVTTGATLEACGKAICSLPGVQLSIATLCYTAGQ